LYKSKSRSTAMIPDYAKGKESAIRILRLNQRQSKIDPQNSKGTVLVTISFSLSRQKKHSFIFL